MPFPDEDLVSTLLLEYHLEDLTNTSLVPTSLLESCLQTADLHAHKRMRSQKEQIFPAYLTMQILRHHRDK